MRNNLMYLVNDVFSGMYNSANFGKREHPLDLDAIWEVHSILDEILEVHSILLTIIGDILILDEHWTPGPAGIHSPTLEREVIQL